MLVDRFTANKIKLANAPLFNGGTDNYLILTLGSGEVIQSNRVYFGGTIIRQEVETSENLGIGSLAFYSADIMLDNFDREFERITFKGQTMDITVRTIYGNIVYPRFYISGVDEQGTTIKLTLIEDAKRWASSRPAAPTTKEVTMESLLLTVGTQESVATKMLFELPDSYNDFFSDMKVCTQAIKSSVSDKANTRLEILKDIAQIMGCVFVSKVPTVNATTGHIEYNEKFSNIFKPIETGTVVLDGGTLANYATGDKVDGNDIDNLWATDLKEEARIMWNFWSDVPEIDAGIYGDTGYFRANEIHDVEISRRSQKITGIKISYSSDVKSVYKLNEADSNGKYPQTEFTRGEDYGVVITIDDNSLICPTNIDKVLEFYGTKFVGKEFYSGTATIGECLALESGDVVSAKNTFGTLLNIIVGSTTNTVGTETIIDSAGYGTVPKNPWD